MNSDNQDDYAEDVESSPSRPNGDADYKVGYRHPPLASRFEPGRSGNPRGRRKKVNIRNIGEELRQVYLREISVREGKSERRLSAVVLLYEKLLRDALKGDSKSATLAVRLARELGVLHFKDKTELDLSILTDEERALCDRAFGILRNARILK